MTAENALRLEQWLSVEAAFWMNLQNSYELDQASEKLGKKIKRTIVRRSSPSSVQAVVALFRDQRGLRSCVHQGYMDSCIYSPAEP
jgi:hypothetical protein